MTISLRVDDSSAFQDSPIAGPALPALSAPAQPGLIQRIFSAVSGVFSQFGDAVDHAALVLLAKVTFIPVTKEGHEANPEGTSLFLGHLALKVHSAAKHLLNVIRTALRRAQEVSSKLSPFKAIGLVSLPLDIWEVGQAFRKLLKTKDGDSRFIAALRFFSELADVADGLIDIVALVHLAVDLGSTFVNALLSVIPVLSVISLAGSMVHAFSYGNAKHLESEIRHALETFPLEEGEDGRLHYSKKAVKAALTIMMRHHERCLQREFSVDYAVKDDVRFALEAIRKGQAGATEQAEELVLALRGRLSVRLTGFQIKLTATLVGVIGATLLFAAPMVPVGHAFVLVSALMAIGNLVYQWRSLYHDPKRVPPPEGNIQPLEYWTQYQQVIANNCQ